MKIKTFASIIAFALITSTIHASTQENITEVRSISNYNVSVTTIYQNMSTAHIQEEVEKHSNNGTLSFVLGQELIKRWTQS
ncbi:hypothetical protein [Sulfurovum sp.]|uniref:hypothetical protein n=1 Tax=Sulfurovum sp. TaxID=1969726 RepID=UPI0035697CFD